jgi:hypothetical protein
MLQFRINQRAVFQLNKTKLLNDLKLQHSISVTRN